MLTKHFVKPLFLIVCISVLFAGCTVNINVGKPAEDATKETDGKNIFDYIFSSEKQKTMHECRSSIYISNTAAATDTAISSSDLTVSTELVATLTMILQSSTIQDEICEEYPGAEYTLSLEPIDETEIFALIATSENPEHLEEICNLAVSLFCEAVPQIINGFSCKIIDYPHSVQEVGIE